MHTNTLISCMYIVLYHFGIYIYAYFVVFLFSVFNTPHISPQSSVITLDLLRSILCVHFCFWAETRRNISWLTFRNINRLATNPLICFSVFYHAIPSLRKIGSGEGRHPKWKNCVWGTHACFPQTHVGILHRGLEYIHLHPKKSNKWG